MAVQELGIRFRQGLVSLLITFSLPRNESRGEDWGVWLSWREAKGWSDQWVLLSVDQQHFGSSNIEESESLKVMEGKCPAQQKPTTNSKFLHQQSIRTQWNTAIWQNPSGFFSETPSNFASRLSSCTGTSCASSFPEDWINQISLRSALLHKSFYYDTLPPLSIYIYIYKGKIFRE